MIYCILISLAVVALDQISKLLVLKFIDLGEIVPCIKGVFHLTYIKNDGAAFGILQNHRWVFMVISVLAIAAIYLHCERKAQKPLGAHKPCIYRGRRHRKHDRPHFQRNGHRFY